MRRALALAGVVWLALRLVRRASSRASGAVVVGYADGSTLELDAPSAPRERLVELAGAALAR